VHYLHHFSPREDIVAHYLAADVMLVTSLRDGMNLVAKDYVACRHDETGALVLSEFTGAPDELGSALSGQPARHRGHEDIDAAFHSGDTEGIAAPHALPTQTSAQLRRQPLGLLVPARAADKPHPARFAAPIAGRRTMSGVVSAQPGWAGTRCSRRRRVALR
jgi:Glycosyltransferase family 20